MLDLTRGAEQQIEGWVRRGKISSAEGSKVLRQFLAQARRNEARMEKVAHSGSRRVLRAVAGAMAGQAEELQAGLVGLSKRLRVIERQYASARSKSDGRRRRAPAGTGPEGKSSRAPATRRKAG